MYTNNNNNETSTFLDMARPARSCSSIAVPSVPSRPGHLESYVMKNMYIVWSILIK